MISSSMMERTPVMMWLMALLATLQTCAVYGTLSEYRAIGDHEANHWTEWSLWSECSRTCGGGASYQTRGCQLGSMCAGRAIRYKTCNTKECPHDEPDFRSQQCAAYNDEKFENRTIEWEPVEALAPEEQCSLVCRVKDHNFTRMLAPKVLDGTRCNKHSVDMCIAGKCQTIGCDYQFNSAAVLDLCGACNGDNTTCEFVKGRKLVASRVTGLHEVMVIPAGSRAIKLTSKDLGSTLGFHEKGEEKGLNQSPLQAEEGRYRYSGTVVQYRTFRSGRQQIVIEEAITQDLIVTIFLFDIRQSREKVHYQYMASLTHAWKTRGWSRCSASCGGGQQASVLECTDLATGETVVDSRCEGQKPEIKNRNCNNIDCPPRWEPEPWHVCTKSCGSGSQIRDVYCVQKVSSSMTRRLNDDMCSGSKPVSAQACNTDPCPYWKPESWSQCSVSCGRGMSTRDVPCRNHRNEAAIGCDASTMPSMRKKCLPGVPCLPDPETNTARVEKPVPVITTDSAAQPHQRLELPSFHAGEWSSCSTSCGPGIRTRSVRCKIFLRAFGSSFDLNELDCQGEARPHDVEDCQDSECAPTQMNESSANPPSVEATDPNVVFPDPTLSHGSGPEPHVDVFIWRYVGYTPCSVSCVGGVQESLVRCVNAFTDLVLSDAFCDYSQKLPSIQRSCNERACPPEWKVFLYGECSASCGPGVKYPSDTYCIQTTARTASSPLTMLGEDQCTGPRPADPVPCQGMNCPAIWVLSEWSECSATCGQGPGNKTRTLGCHQTTPSGEEVQVDFNLCTLPVPHTVEECDNDQCPPYWITRPSSQCSQSCGKGTQSVTLSCHQVTMEGSIIELSPLQCPIPPPPNHQPCNEVDCPAEWTSQTLSECSASCGLGIKLRSVLCSSLLGNGTQVFVEPQNCVSALRPADRVVCNLPTCSDAQILANYSTYRQTSPSGKVRLAIGQDAYIYPSTTITVRCPVVNFKQNQVVWERGQTPILDTDHRVKIIDRGILRIKYVKERDAGVYACRAGDQRETFTLHISLPIGPPEPNTQPANIRWEMGPWTECTVSCGGGLQLRQVSCHHTNLMGRSKPRGLGVCKNAGMDEPERSRECNTQPCDIHWATEEWSDCSDECVGASKSVQTRRVFCRSPTLDVLPDQMCPSATQPLHERLCNNQDCKPKWLVTRWSSCSSSCGANAVQRRKIRCVSSSSRRKMDSTICAAVYGEPPIMKKCLLEPCPNEVCIDEGSYCSLVQRLHMCTNPSYQRRCCKTCLSYG